MCGVCGSSFSDVRSRQVLEESERLKPSSPRKKLKTTFLVGLLSALVVLLSSGLFIIFFLSGLFVTGLLLVTIAMLVVLGIIGAGPSRTMARYGWRTQEEERELEEEEAKEESD